MIVNLNDWVDSAQSTQGETPSASFTRLNDFLNGTLSHVKWSARGWRVATQGAAYDKTIEPYERFLHIAAHASGRTVCARCLKPLEVGLTVDTVLQVFQTEASADEAAMTEDADALPDPIVSSRQFDLIVQVEEELLLELDLHAVHEPQCDLPAQAPQDATSPFAMLAALKK